MDWGVISGCSSLLGLILAKLGAKVMRDWRRWRV